MECGPTCMQGYNFHTNVNAGKGIYEIKRFWFLYHWHRKSSATTPNKSQSSVQRFRLLCGDFFVRKLDEHVGEYGGVCGVKV